MLSLQQQLRSQQPTSGFLHSQCLGLTALNIWVSLLSMCSFPFFHHLHLPLHSTSCSCHSQHLGFPVWIRTAQGAEGFYSILPGGSHTSLFQSLSQTERPRQHFPRRGRESRSKSCLQTPGWLSGVILGKEDDGSETRATARELLRMISSFNKCQQTPKKANTALPAPTSSNLAPITHFLGSLCLQGSLPDSKN